MKEQVQYDKCIPARTLTGTKSGYECTNIGFKFYRKKESDMRLTRSNVNEFKREHEVMGVGFIKSRKSVDKIMDMAADMLDKAKSVELPIVEIIVDEGASDDIDRDKVTSLCEWMEKDYVKVVIVREINDITKDRDDLEAFLLKARDLDVMVYVLNTGVQVKAEPDNGAGC